MVIDTTRQEKTTRTTNPRTSDSAHHLRWKRSRQSRPLQTKTSTKSTLTITISTEHPKTPELNKTILELTTGPNKTLREQITGHNKILKERTTGHKIPATTIERHSKQQLKTPPPTNGATRSSRRHAPTSTGNPTNPKEPTTRRRASTRTTTTTERRSTAPSSNRPPCTRTKACTPDSWKARSVGWK